MSKLKIGITSGVILFLLFVIAQLFGITIYDNFSERKEYRLEKAYDYPQITIQNNNPFSLAYYNPLFFIDLKITNSTGQVDCFMSYDKEKRCDSKRWDLSKIETGGGSSNIGFFIFANRYDFTINATPYLNFINMGIPLPIGTTSWNCQHTSNDYYWCVRVRN